MRCEHFTCQFILQEPFSSSCDQAVELKVDLGSSQQICHRDLKLENTLLDGSPAPRLKICDFGYSKVTSVQILEYSFVEMYLKLQLY